MSSATDLSTTGDHGIFDLQKAKGVGMPAKWHKYSYSAQIEERRSIMAVIVIVVSLALTYTIINSCIVSTYYVETSTMEPTVAPGDCVVTSLIYSNKADTASNVSVLIPPKRGDLVLISPAYQKVNNIALRSINALVAFLTFQRFRPFDPKDSWGERPQIRRIAAFPGDSIYMENFILHVKPAGQAHYLTEFELSSTDYNLTINKLPESWSDNLPLSGSFPEMTLGKAEFFVLCDNRMTSSDSRIWGPVPESRIKGKVVLRYWPFSRFGRP
jgi:signal peptidase I